MLPAMFKGCKYPRNLLKRKQSDGSELVPRDAYAFALRKHSGSWVQQDESCKRAKLLLYKNWVDTFARDAEEASVDLTQTYEDAPDILALNDDERFHDADGNPIDIETRGERRENGVYFKVLDIERMLGMRDLSTTLTTGHTNYTRGATDDYVTFRSDVLHNVRSRSLNKRLPTLFLTYKGLVRVLNVSQNPTARSFRSWAARILQTVQMGNEDARIELAGSLIGVEAKTVQAVLNRCPEPSSCVYLVALGTCDELRDSLGITSANVEGDSIVAKWGRTDNFYRRLGEHEKDFGAVSGVSLGVIKYIIVDPVHLSACETEVKYHLAMKDWAYESSGQEVLRNGGHRTTIRNEMVIIPKAHLKHVERLYDSLQSKYSGRFKEMVEKVERLKDQLDAQKQLYDEKVGRLQDKVDMQELHFRKQTSLLTDMVEILKYQRPLRV